MVFPAATFVCSRCQHRILPQILSQFRGVATGTREQSDAHPSYYQVLGVPKDASSSEIKAAYFKLSKTLHPDASPQNPDQHDLFVQLNEAYGILGKTVSRKEYDVSLTRPQVTEIRVHNADVSPDNPFGGPTESEWFPRTHIFREGGEEKVSENYYGIKGVQRVNNMFIVYGCVLFIVSGALFHFFVFRQSSQYATQKLDEKDRKIAELYNQAKERARKNGPKKQLELLRERHNEYQLKLKQIGSDV